MQLWPSLSSVCLSVNVGSSPRIIQRHKGVLWPLLGQWRVGKTQICAHRWGKIQVQAPFAGKGSPFQKCTSGFVWTPLCLTPKPSSSSLPATEYFLCCSELYGTFQLDIHHFNFFFRLHNKFNFSNLLAFF